MRNLNRTAGWAIVGIGLLVGLVPFVSVWRTSGLVLEQLPHVSAAEISDQRRGPTAMFDDSFELARRTYTGSTIESVQAAFVADGFDRMGGERFSKSCCGESDAVWATVERANPDSVVAVLSVADSDWQTAWKVYAVVSLLVILAGVATILRRDKQPDRIPELV